MEKSYLKCIPNHQNVFHILKDGDIEKNILDNKNPRIDIKTLD